MWLCCTLAGLNSWPMSSAVLQNSKCSFAATALYVVGRKHLVLMSFIKCVWIQLFAGAVLYVSECALPSGVCFCWGAHCWVFSGWFEKIKDITNSIRCKSVNSFRKSRPNSCLCLLSVSVHLLCHLCVCMWTFMLCVCCILSDEDLYPFWHTTAAVTHLFIDISYKK